MFPIEFPFSLRTSIQNLGDSDRSNLDFIELFTIKSTCHQSGFQTAKRSGTL